MGSTVGTCILSTSATMTQTSVSASRTPDEYIAALAGQYASLQDSCTVSGTATSRKFSSYVYTRKLLIRKSLEHDESKHIIFCTHCTRGEWMVEAKSTTSSLQIRHLRQRHPLLPTSQEEEIQWLEQLEKSVNTGKETPFSIMAQGRGIATRKQVDRFDNKVFREHLSSFLVNTNASLSVVENSSFRKLLQYCNPSAVMISRRTASRDIVSLYSKLLPRIQNMLREFTVEHGGRISITLDAWSSSTQIPFLGVTGHFIEPVTWKFRSLLLGFERLEGSHSAQALDRVLLTIVQKFHVAGSIRAITADSASVNTAMFRNLEAVGHLSGFKQNDAHVRCMGHVINLAVQTLLKSLHTIPILDEGQLADEEGNVGNQGTQLAQASYKARKIIAKIRSSYRLWESLQAQAQAARIPPKRPILDMPIR